MLVFAICGYWKDEPECLFEGYLIAEYDDVPEGYDDDDIFFFGMNEADIVRAIDEGENFNEDFVITSYNIHERV